jgi:hypothetical protein
MMKWGVNTKSRLTGMIVGGFRPLFSHAYSLDVFLGVWIADGCFNVSRCPVDAHMYGLPLTLAHLDNRMVSNVDWEAIRSLTIVLEV